ncbi:RecB family nuclease, putative [Cellulomonas flavigena DSM 20109]|uniref:RecB family nuclease, putative n=1 Tax=Cellulomonas flavigena (strain ATCC 482 / DSM 20109 / BCRC 11376 / JCM 18109 / NBRC 3775 / NCIMB 8073 / NRS 134) TaxID=446466 RepID=D5UBW2_CELFN|nr:TM0106 family RecB-like putative nuclease [Cellulomonas flavigena]ADG76121.1 RecB family nuclease, putative [Cellulomonas flavigena DSM 20109]
MILLDDGTLTYSASDLTAAARCEHAVLRALDARLGRGPAAEPDADVVLARVAHLGDEHEQRVLRGLVERYGVWRPGTRGGLAQVPATRDPASRAHLEAAHAATLDRLGSADVVHQAAFFDGRFVGRADFLVRDDDGAWSVRDAKLARNAQPTALLQVAAYADQLARAGVPVAREVQLVLGDAAVTRHAVADLVPVYRERRARLQELLDAHRAQDGPVTWGDTRWAACGRCSLCTAELEARRDVTLVAGVYERQRALLGAAGVATIDELAALPDDREVEGLSPDVLARVRLQARLQLEQEARNADPAHPVDVPWALTHPPRVAALLPPPDPGDIFFDFEGDPLWYDAAMAGEPDAWGLEYLFGVVENPPAPEAEAPFVAFWAHDRAEERVALREFLAYLADRRARFPGMHVYHYAAYEKTTLRRLAARHGEGEAQVDGLLREGLLVDLYTAVKAGVRTGQRSYSLKKLEPLYMATGRGDGVTNAADSIVEYAEAVAARDAGRLDDWNERIKAIEVYNHYDCDSTLGLRDWLLARLAEVGVAPSRPVVLDPEAEARAAELGAPDPLEDELLALAGPGPGEGVVRTPGRQAVALVGAALRYHQREDKPYWWGHFDRLSAHPSDWTERRNVLLADRPGAVEVVTDWHLPPGKQVERRVLRMTGRLEPGSDLRPGAQAVGLYDAPLPACVRTSVDGPRGWCERMTVLEVRADVEGRSPRDVLVVEETRPKGSEPFAELPMALAPAGPIGTAPLREAIRRLAERVRDAVADGSAATGDAAAATGATPDDAPDVSLPRSAVLDLARRTPPRTRSGAPLPTADGDLVDVLTRAVLDLDDSYLAVQGPPGTGKTYTGARVIAALVERGWRVGVVAQSHAVVENMLRGVAGAGVPAGAIAKKLPTDGRDATADAPWTWVPDKGFGAFWSAHPGGADGAGAVLGGTAWDLVSTTRLPSAPLDLLVVDEAGQFALATTFAVAGSARNLLLLGDPQQLPQVSQGTHPEPVDRSALGWLTDGHDTLPAELGYFLPVTYRLHPELCAAVSTLAYEGRLVSAPAAAARSLDGVPAGVHGVLVEHEGNAVASPEEAEVVARTVAHLVGRTWRDPAAAAPERPLTPADVVVVAAYNAQVWTVRRALDAAGFTATRVGTVDRFQGQEAPVVVVTTAASSPSQVPRGLDFLLDRNRINVAVSRGQWAAFVVRSTRLSHTLPHRPESLERLGAFVGLTTRSVVDVPAAT